MTGIPEPGTYYESLNEVQDGDMAAMEQFEDQTRWLRLLKRVNSLLLTISVIGLVFSIIPGIPAIWLKLSDNPWPSVLASSHGWKPSQWLLVWPSCALLSGGAVLVLAKLQSILTNHLQSKEPKPHRLSTFQKNFLRSYEAHRELEKYKLNRLEDHLRKAKTILHSIVENEVGSKARLFPRFSGGVNFEEDVRVRRASMMMIPIADAELDEFDVRVQERYEYLARGEDAIARLRTAPPSLEQIISSQEYWSKYHPWIRINIDDRTNTIRSAFMALRDRAIPRMDAGDQVDVIGIIVHLLADYYYYSMPELRAIAPGDEEQANALADERLDEFARRALSLPPVEQATSHTASSPARELASQKQMLFSLVGNRNPLIRFFSWLVTAGMATSGLVGLAHATFSLAIDTPCILTVISTSVLAAAGLTVVHTGKQLPVGRQEMLPVQDVGDVIATNGKTEAMSERSGPGTMAE